jgi:hypothetical protein
VVDDRQQGPAAVRGQRLGDKQPQGDGADPGRAVRAHGEGGLDPQSGGLPVVAGQEAPGVEGGAGSQVAHEQLGRDRALVVPAIGQRLVAQESMAAHAELEPVAGLVGDAEVGHRRSPRYYRNIGPR